MKLNKYQLGGGTEESDQYAMLATSIQQAIIRGQSPQAVYESLITRNMDKKIALQLVSSVVQNMLENGDLEEEDLQTAKQKDAATEEALLKDKELADAETEKDNAAEQQMNDYNQQSTDIALDTSGADQEEEDSNNAFSEGQYGFQAGGATKEDIYNAQFADDEGEEEDVPFSMEALLKSTPGTQNFNFAGIQDYYMPYAPIGSSSDLEFIDFSDTPEKKYGGAQKKQFAKNVLNLLKKAEGGPQEDEVTDTNNAIQTDDLLGTVKKKQSSFVDAMGNTAKKVKIDEWFNKLKEVGDPMLDEILSPAPKGDPIKDKEQQVNQMLGENEEQGAGEGPEDEGPEDEEAEGEEMRLGGGKRRRQKRQYNRLHNQANRLLGIDDYHSMAYPPLSFGNIPTNQYSKFDNFTDQRFNTIDAPTLQKYFTDLAKQQLQQQQRDVELLPSIDVYDRGLFGRAKKYRVSYPQPTKKSAEVQADEVVTKNNIKYNTPYYIPDPGYTEADDSVNPAPAGTMYDVNNNTSNAPVNYEDYDPTEVPTTVQFQGGGFVSESDNLSPENLGRFVYGGDDSYGESKNVDDPYFSDMEAYPEMGRGGNRRRAIKNMRRRTASTAWDTLFPANRGIYNAGSYAQQQGMPFIAGTNDVYSGSMEGKPLSYSDVTKRGVFGRPKEWTDYYGTGNSNKQEEIKLDNQYANEEEYLDDQRGNYSGLNPITQMRLNSADRRTQRQLARGERNGMNEPLEGPISSYDSPRDIRLDKRQGVNWREEPIRLGNEVKDYQNKDNPYVQDAKAAAEGNGLVDPNSVNIPEETGSDPRTYDELMKDKRSGKKFQDGGSKEQNINFYDELESSMYDYEPILYPPSYRRGGNLPKAAFGLADTPVSYTNNPAFEGQAEVDWTDSSHNMNNTGLTVSPFWSNEASFSSTGPANNLGEVDPIQITTDPTQAEEQQTKKVLDPNVMIGVNRKRKDMMGTDPQAMLETVNASANTALGMIDQSRNAESQRALYENNFDPMKLYGKKSRIDKGDWETNLGVKNINQTGSDRLGRSKQYGGGMYDLGGMYDEEALENEEDYLMDDEENEYKNGGEKITFMSEKQIKEFLAAGGKLEFI